MHDVFISYSNEDKQIADDICLKLESGGIRCWYAPRDILPGADWREAIMTAISSARVFVLVYSKESNQSRQVLNEVTGAFNSSCVMIPFRIDDVAMSPALSYYLSNVHWLDAVGPPRAAHIDELVKTVNCVLHGGTVETKRPAPIRKHKKWRVGLAAVLAVIVLGAALFFLRNSRPFADDPAAIDKACGSVVQIRASIWGRQLTCGTGFACFDDNIIVTTASLFDFEDMQNSLGTSREIRIEATTDSGLTIAVSDIIAYDAEMDIAILSTSGKHGIPLLKHGNTDSLLRGEKMVVIGTCMDENVGVTLGAFDHSESIGLFSSVSEGFFTEMIKLEIPVQSGLAGGAVINSKGEVVGLLSYGINQFSYAVPIEQIEELWKNNT